ncbi:MAG: hypothetical protein GY856_22655 [bacterium]|nr:hypothetical protein [bacterium]
METTRIEGPGFRSMLWLGVLGLLVRLPYFSEHAGSAFFNVAILDEKYYDALARALVAHGDVAQLNPGFRPLLYPFFLAVWYRLGGEWGYVLALAVQHLLGIATAVLVAGLATRLYRRPSAGAVAGGLYLLAGPPLYFEGELLITGLFTFLTVLQLLILSRADLSGRWAAAWWLAAGMVTALAAQARPNLLIFLVAYPGVALLRRRADLKTRAALAAAALIGAFAVMLLVAGVHHQVIGRFQCLGEAGGVNFYLGNKAGADGMIPRQDRPVTYGEDYRDSVQLFAEEVYRDEMRKAGEDEGGDLPPGRVSRYWTARALDEIRRDPARWLRLMGRKAWFLVWNREIPNNKNYAFIREHESVVLKILPVRWWLLLCLAPLGFHLAWRRGDRGLLAWIAAFVGLYSLGVVLFFVNSRYRIPLWPAMAILAAGGGLALVDALRERRRRDLAIALVTAGGLAAISLINWFRIAPESYARDFFFRSVANLEKGHVAAAEADARQSVELDGSDPAAIFQLGNAALAGENYALALDSFRTAAELYPHEPRIFNNLGVVLERFERPGEAYRAYLRAIELTSSYPPPLVNAALLELRAGLLERAEAKISRAEELGFESVTLLCARAFVERDRRRGERSARMLEEARRLEPDIVRRLREENRRALPPDLFSESGAL